MFENQSSSAPANSKQALMTNRIIWGALCLGVVVIAAVFAFVVEPPTPSGNNRDLFIYLPFGALICIPIAFIVRAVIFKSNTNEDGLVELGAYGNAIIICCALCEGPAIVALVFAFFIGPVFPTCIAAGIAFLALLAAFPPAGPITLKAHQTIGNLNV
ncbi:hypothetical protein [Poriferisphaera sp. WC338]|uniref:hypothetical protein n=1 Tax=Poriferisphaera sp. WC338 TaxID=3425129 RepID=UPI003D81442F